MSAEKKEGAEQTCKCGTERICIWITKEWQGKTERKLQWQNKSNSKPHFKFAGPGKFDCNIPDEPSQQPTQPTASNFKPKLITQSELQLWNDIIEKIKEYHLVAKQNFENDPRIEKNGQLHGLLTNQSFTVLNAMLQKKRNDS